MGYLVSCPLWHQNVIAFSTIFLNLNGQVMGEGEEQGVVKIADFGLARIYQAPLKPLSENGVGCIVSYISSSCSFFFFCLPFFDKKGSQFKLMGSLLLRVPSPANLLSGYLHHRLSWPFGIVHQSYFLGQSIILVLLVSLGIRSHVLFTSRIMCFSAISRLCLYQSERICK